MIVCSEHWELLRRRVCERGMGYLLHQPHAEFEDFAAQLCGRPVHPITFDPLVEARAVAEYLAVSYGGTYLNNLTPAGGARCSLCELIAHFPTESIDSDSYWPMTIVALVERKAREHGLLPRAA